MRHIAEYTHQFGSCRIASEVYGAVECRMPPGVHDDVVGALSARTMWCMSLPVCRVHPAGCHVNVVVPDSTVCTRHCLLL